MSRRSNPQQLISYVLRYSLKERDNQLKEHATVILRHNLRSRSLKGYIREYLENESFRGCRRKNSVLLYHDILSFSPQDKNKITDKMLKEIATKYVLEKGPDNLFLVIAHHEKHHQHLHAIVSGINLKGYSSRQSKQQFKSMKLHLERFINERFPELVHSAIQHERSKLVIPRTVEAIKAKRYSDKERLSQILNIILEKTQTLDEFLKQLESPSFQPYYRNDRLQGATFNGRKFRFNRLNLDNSKLQELIIQHDKETLFLQDLQNTRQLKGRKPVLAREAASETNGIKQHLNERGAETFEAIRRRSLVMEYNDKELLNDLNASER
jgi:hypothetical protein